MKHPFQKKKCVIGSGEEFGCNLGCTKTGKNKLKSSVGGFEG